ncbi:PKD domain-containing protein [Jiangella ureilytica]|uniref:PKD domain-containing protein n=1 Tax=Jiangella ureilytica TaxID=2530374 RepID=A0A4R4RLV9_9ACTN|nr:ThuA domain-containing protein [Jiangella ureilytica]TDC50404.1 PKD domain-containing protein [Jiangella ureilytica]
MRRLYRYIPFTLVVAFLASLLPGIAISAAHVPESEYQVLFFHKTTGFRHDSIPAALNAVEELGVEHGFTVTETQDASIFTDDGLAEFEAIVFFTDGENTLNAGQRQAFERYIHRGGGFAGLHSTSNMDKTNWPWWSDLMGGAFFRNHPSGADQFQDATVRIEDDTHPSTAGLPAEWIREDEWYNFTANPREKVHVLATLDESTYNPGSGAMGEDHPIAWCANFDGGRTWYTALGHSSEHYDEPLMRDHLLGGIEWAAGVADGDCGEPRDGIPTEASFEKIALDDNTANPMELAVAPDGRVFYVELAGTVKIYDPDTGAVSVAAQIPVHRGNENGLLGIALDPDFETNQWLYLFYSAPSPEVQHVSRFTVDGDELDLASESVLLEIPHQREVCCHSAGSMRFGPDGNLYISTGDDTAHFASQGFAPIDGRIYDNQVSEDAKRSYDARRTSGNTNDLRGKIIRITPEDDGTYSIPEGNLFPPETSDPDLTRPEIYTMGHRNPFRIAIDDETGWLYAGEVGPDAGSDNPNRGPRGYDEWNQIREAGNYGWPYCIGNNQAYREWDFATSTPGEFFDCENGPVNDSPFNTGLDVVPPAKDAFIWYPYGVSPQFPELPTGGGRTAYAGDVYHYEEGLLGDGQFPEYYDGAVFVMEWSRKWIGALRLDENGDYESFEQFMPSTLFRSPHDMEFGPDGAMYLIEWGMDFNYAGENVNPDSGLYKINYTEGARTPIALASSDTDSGPTPLEVAFSSEGSHDPDGDELTYAWDFGDGSTAAEPNPTHTFTESGEYTVRLTVTDPSGRSGNSNLTITAGNTRPEVTIELPANGQVFDWGDEIPYRVSVVDAEDGSGAAIDCERVTVQQGLFHDEGGNAHVHPGQAQNGCEGVLATQHDAEHGDAADISLTVTASYTDDGGEAGAPALTGGVTHLLQQQRKEAEHFDQSAGIDVSDANDEETGGGDAIAGQDGAWAAYEPYNLTGIGEMSLRVATADDTTVEVRRDAPDGELLGTAQIEGSVEIGRTAGPEGFHSAVRLGGSSQLEKVELPAGVMSGVEDFTISAWVNWAGGQTWARVFDFGSGTGNYMFLTPGAGGTNNLRYAITTGAGEQQINGSQPLPTNGWHHVAVTQSGSTGTLYLDGAPIGTNTGMTLTPSDLGQTTQNWVGDSQWSADPLLNGAVDDVNIFSRALSPSEIQALVAAPGGGDGGDVAWYRFDEDGGTTATDSSGQGNDATIVIADDAATWQDVTIELTPTEGTFPLHLVFPAGPVRVNWMELAAGDGGPGTCHHPDERGTVVIGDIDSGVTNHGVDGGCTVNDLIRDEEPWAIRGEFIRHVRDVTDQLVEDGVLSTREALAVNLAAGRSDVGKG